MLKRSTDSLKCAIDQYIGIGHKFALFSLSARFCFDKLRGTQRQFSENICSEDDLRSRIFGTFVVKFLAYEPVLGFSNILKMV